MPTFNIVRQNKRDKSFRTQSITDRYELNSDSENVYLTGDVAIEDKDWNIGLIVGSSGSGKSTIAKEIFPNHYVSKLDYSNTRAIIDEMPKDKNLDVITQVFNSCGLGTVWTWLKPYSCLSTGEQMRCDLARCILENREIIVFDEFTSVVDREIAKLAANCISKTIKKSNKKFVAVSCHRDIIEWLEPDWIYDTDKKEFFFAHSVISDQRLKSKYSKPIESFGSALRSFTI